MWVRCWRILLGLLLLLAVVVPSHSLATSCAQSAVRIVNAMTQGDVTATVEYRGRILWSGSVAPGQERYVPVSVPGWWIEGVFDVRARHAAWSAPQYSGTGYIHAQDLLFDNQMHRFTAGSGGLDYEGYDMNAGFVDYSGSSPSWLAPIDAPLKWLVRFNACADKRIGAWIGSS